MTLRAYMQVETGRDAADFVREARMVGGVIAARALFEPLDAIVVVEAADMTALEMTVGNVHGVPGMKFGDTRIARSV